MLLQIATNSLEGFFLGKKKKNMYFKKKAFFFFVFFALDPNICLELSIKVVKLISYLLDIEKQIFQNKHNT